MKTTNEIPQMEVRIPLMRERTNRYGTIPDLDEEELADPDELEEQIHLQEWGPILALPVKTHHGWKPANYEAGVDIGAFGTVDFERGRPEFDKARYKAEKLREEFGDVLILLDIVRERLPGNAKYLVLKYLKAGMITLDQINHFDMREFGRLFLRARRIQQEIFRLEDASKRRREQRLTAWLAALN